MYVSNMYACITTAENAPLRLGVCAFFQLINYRNSAATFTKRNCEYSKLNQSYVSLIPFVCSRRV